MFELLALSSKQTTAPIEAQAHKLMRTTSRKQKRTIRLLGRSQKTELFLNSKVILTASYKFSTEKRIYDHHADNDAKEERVKENEL